MVAENNDKVFSDDLDKNDINNFIKMFIITGTLVLAVLDTGAVLDNGQ